MTHGADCEESAWKQDREAEMEEQGKPVWFCRGQSPQPKPLGPRASLLLGQLCSRNYWWDQEILSLPILTRYSPHSNPHPTKLELSFLICHFFSTIENSAWPLWLSG